MLIYIYWHQWFPKPSTKDTCVSAQKGYSSIGVDEKVTDKQIQMGLCQNHYQLPHSNAGVMKRLKRSHTETHQRVKCVVGTDLEELGLWNNHCEGAQLSGVMQE